MTTDATFTASSAAKKLESIHRRMADVTEAEALAALAAEERPETSGATMTLTIHYLLDIIQGNRQ